MSPPSLPTGLYGMVDTSFGAAVPMSRALLAGGARVLQLRAKTATTEERVELIRALLPLTRAADALLIVNDDLEAACQGGADGLHLGQDDGSLALARARLGPTALLGRSTHDLAQVRSLDQSADYIGFGPVFATATKDTGYAGRGLSRLRSVLAESPVPVVAIGGIGPERLPTLRAMGVRHWAVISSILGGVQRPEVWTQRARSMGD